MTDSGIESRPSSEDEGGPNSANRRKFKILCWMAERKRKRASFVDFLEMCQKNSKIEVRELNLESCDINNIEPCHVLIHHHPEQIVQECYVDKLKLLLHKYPNMKCIDPLESVQRLLCRFKIVERLKELVKDTEFLVPETIDMSDLCHLSLAERHTRLKSIMVNSQLHYPVLAKRLLSKNHQMMLVFGEDGLETLATFLAEAPSLLQQFQPHNGVMYKVKMYGENHFLVQKRDSLSASGSNYQTVAFFSSDISRQKLDATKGGEKDGCSHCGTMPADFSITEDVVRKLTTIVSKGLGLQLLCIDVIIATEGKDAGKIFLIDVNYFPPMRCRSGSQEFKGQGGQFLYNYVCRTMNEHTKSTLV